MGELPENGAQNAFSQPSHASVNGVMDTGGLYCIETLSALLERSSSTTTCNLMNKKLLHQFHGNDDTENDSKINTGDLDRKS